jgi:ABC-2 type transport system ATP-binding protein
MPQRAQMAIVVENLTLRYAPQTPPALNGLSLAVQQGEIFGLLGPNGAGKTTAISILSTILKPDSGRVSLCGIDSLRDPVQVRRLIGLVPQEIALYPELTAWENLDFFGRLQGLGGGNLRSRIVESLKAVGLEEKGFQKVSTYSGGMKRRANLAIGMIHTPRVLFLDEPTVGIDAQSRELIMQRLKDQQKRGTTIIYTTHYMEEAQQLCDRVAIMDKGRILCQGTPAQVVEGQPPCADLNERFLHLTGRALRD